MHCSRSSAARVELKEPCDQRVSVRVHCERALVTSLKGITTLMIGCNLSCRRRLLDDVGYFDVRLGSGAKIPSGEDWDFVYRSHKAGAKIVFSPEVLVFHDHGRRSYAEVESLRFGYAIGRWAFYCKHAAAFDAEALRVATHDFTRLVTSLVRARTRLRTLVPVALGVTSWLQTIVRPLARRSAPGSCPCGSYSAGGRSTGRIAAKRRCQTGCP